ncbi:Fe(2+) transporter permease subunit FeoB [Oxynema aestuarii]|uniref:Ferrous iron transport protein B n=1 Tax=Oxynema aestuarii AP17 TaxID=2064643 RepID=A0A6H1TSN0_9CYAN|nr:Fe(2+) transporter permease subunit FeoB [Oxynema aestuarii]QIZ69216.1 Fe(2+) transporter permease subunit FeoB [Oxynema aestuarii AP17]RMH77322.1 MAG: Fe(2+) transporter permease subunit FeoB [Cyanobacteria bacterium J007]
MNSTITARATIATIGNPNCGKTTLFNALTGSNQITGNWPGVTVDRVEGTYNHDGQTVTIIDLPGVYSLDAEDQDTGLDERIARDYLLSGAVDLVANVIDASNLERNLYLTTQLIEMRLPVVVILNMVDVARERGFDIDLDRLCQHLGCPVVAVVASKSQGLSELRAAIDRGLRDRPIPSTFVAYPAVVEDAIADLMPYLDNPARVVDPRWTALRLLEYDDIGVPTLQRRELDRVLAHWKRRVGDVLGDDLDIAIADARYTFIRHLSEQVVARSREVSLNLTQRIDRIVLDRWLGIPLFFAVMYLMFLFAIDFGNVFIDFFDILTGTIFVDGFGRLLTTVGIPDWLVVLLANGAGGGLQTVSTFIPVIACTFLFLAFLEDSGYMARAAFVMDRLMRFIGLPGKSFVPMLVGFGCNVPAILATRTLESPRDRLMTILMNPFMSCGARLPVYALFAAAFFPVGGQNIVFALYLVGIGAAICTGLILKHTILRGDISPFVMELPPYHLPTLRGILWRTWDRLREFIVRAGKVIVLMVMVLGLLNNVSWDGSLGNSQTSVLSSVSRSVTPVFAPMGIRQENYPATVGVFTGVFAKEAIVGSLDSLYGQLAREDIPPEPDTPFEFWGSIRDAFASIPANLANLGNQLLDPLGVGVGDLENTEIAAESQGVASQTFGQMVNRFDGKIGAFAYLLFVLLYFPCLAATAAIYRETGTRWTVFAGVWTTGLAYWVATVFYQAATFARHPAFSTVWIFGAIALLAGTILGMRRMGRVI